MPGSSFSSPGGFGEVVPSCSLSDYNVLTAAQEKKSETAHSVRPLTIGQLIRATQAHTDAEWRVENDEIGQVCHDSVRSTIFFVTLLRFRLWHKSCQFNDKLLTVFIGLTMGPAASRGDIGWILQFQKVGSQAELRMFDFHLRAHRFL